MSVGGWTGGCLGGRLDEQGVEEETEVDAVLLEQLAALEAGNLDGVFDSARIDVGAIDLLAEHGRIQLDLLPCPLHET